MIIVPNSHGTEDLKAERRKPERKLPPVYPEGFTPLPEPVTKDKRDA